MGHHHHNAEKGLLTAFLLNLSFAAVELAGGYLTQSTAILTDAFHDFMDAMAIGTALLLQKTSAKDGSLRYSYSLKRLSLLSSLILSTLLIFGAIFMFTKGILSINKTQEVHSMGMLILAAIGTLVNGAAYKQLTKTNNNSRSVALHLVEDIGGWIAVFIGAIIIKVTGWNWIDALLTMAIAIYILIRAFKNFINDASLFLQATPHKINQLKIKDELLKLDHVIGVHALHIWSLDGEENVGSVHIVTDKEPFNALNKIQTTLSNHSINHATVQIESKDFQCALNK